MSPRIGARCPFCRRVLTERRPPGPRDGDRRVFAYCAFDQAAWECEPLLGATAKAAAQTVASR
jgi:hypothetical protein